MTKEYKGRPLQGHYVGGAHAVAQFDPSKTHSVEPSVGTRRVVVAYSPRLIERLEPSDLRKLRELGFPVPSVSSVEATWRYDSAAKAKGGDRQEHCAMQGNINDARKEGSTRTNIRKEDLQGKAGLSPGGDGSNGTEETELEWRTGNSHFNTQQGFLEVLHDQYMSLRRLEMDARKYFDEELEVAAEQGWKASTEHLVELKNWIQELEQWIVAGDASSRLRAGVEDSEARVLRARLRKLGMNPGVVEGEDEWFPLSGSPLEEPEGESHQDNLNENFRPPGPKASEALPAAPLQTISVSHREVLEKVEEWRPSIGAELESVFERHRALQRTCKDEVDGWISQGKVVEFLPSKALFHKKGGTGRHKARIVACGNFAKAGNGEEPGSTYAGGIDSTSLRIQLAHCGHQKARDCRWTAGALDIHTAFFIGAARAEQPHPGVEATQGFHQRRHRASARAVVCYRCDIRLERSPCCMVGIQRLRAPGHPNHPWTRMLQAGKI